MKRTIGLLSIMIITSGTALLAGINRWTGNGPYGGRTLVISIDPQRPNIVYAGTYGGGLYKSANWGQSWEAISLSNYGYIATVALDPVTPTMIYAGTYFGLFKSTDEGGTWTKLNVGNDPSEDQLVCLAIDPNSPATIYAGCASGLHKSSDQGGTWQTIGFSGKEVSAINVTPSSSEITFVGVSGDGLYKSTDGGTTFHHVDTGSVDTSVRSIAFDSSSPNTLCIGYLYDGVYRSTDEGLTWQQTLNEPISVQNLAIDPASPTTLYACGNQLFKSLDFGNSWFPVNANLPDQGYLAIDPVSEGTYYLATRSGVFKSLDGGNNWREANSGLSNMGAHALAVTPSAPLHVYAGIERGGGFYTSSDGGWSWEKKLPGDGEAVVIDPTSPNIVYAGMWGDGVFKSTDAGASWRNVSSGLTNVGIWALAIDPQAPSNLYAGTDGGGAYRSTDGGETWFEINNGLTFGVVKAITVDPSVPSTLFAGTFGGGLFRSTDSGVHWTLLTGGLTPSNILDIAVDPTSSAVVYTATDGGIFRSSDGGNSWNQTTFGAYSWAIVLDTSVHTTLFAGSPWGVFKSTDAGESWSAFNAGLVKTHVLSLAIEPVSGGTLYCGTLGGVFSFTFQPTAIPHLNIFSRQSQTGQVDQELASQVLPASYLLFEVDPTTLPSVSPTNPVIIELRLPEGSYLSQSLASGELTDLSVENPEKHVFPLALSEYGTNLNTSTYQPTDVPAGSAGIASHAVQVFRYVAGEDRIWLRVTQSTAGWTASSPENFLGVTIGVGAGVWPPTPGSNWGAVGQFTQENTQFFCDIRNYNFAAHQGRFPVSVSAFYQKTGAPVIGLVVDPAVLNLFTLDQTMMNQLSDNSLLGSVITDFAIVDLNGDGWEDAVTIDRYLRRLYWALGCKDNTFTDVNWIETVGIDPVRVDASDITGDGRPDVLVWDAAGQLVVYTWETLFGNGKNLQHEGQMDLADFRFSSLRWVEPDLFIPIAAAPSVSASALRDINKDGAIDYLFTDSLGDTLNILSGPLTGPANLISYPTGESPAALVVADLNDDGFPDAAVSNSESNSVTIYLNDGQGGFNQIEYPDVGSKPVALETADFNRDGRVDLGVALQGNRAVAFWQGNGDGSFNQTESQKIYFPNIPFAIVGGNFDGENGADLIVGFTDFYRLAVCLSDADGHMQHAYNLNTLGDMELDNVNHIIMTEDNILSLAGGTSIGGVCQRNGVAALSHLPMNLLHTPRSQDLSFSVVNLSEQNILINAELFDDLGRFKQSASLLVEPDRQVARYLTDPALFGGEAAVNDRWVRFFLTGEQTYGFWLANESGSMEYMDGLRLPDPRDAGTRLVLPIVLTGQDAFTDCLIVNPSGKPVRGRCSVYRNGAEIDWRPLTLEGRSRISFNPLTKFPSISETDFLLIQTDQPIISCEMFGDSSTLAALEGLSLDESSSLLYCPHVAAGDFGILYTSTITLVNSASVSASVRLELYGDDGSLTTYTTANVEGLSKVSLNVADLFGPNTPITGYVSIDPLGSTGLTGCVTFGEAGSGRFLSCLPLVRPEAHNFLVSHLANGSLGGIQFYTGFSILNPNAEPQEMKLTAHDQNGLILDSTTITIPIHGRRVFLLNNVMPELTSIFGGYMTLENQSEPPADLMVFGLFGDLDFRFLSAVAAQSLH